MKTKPTRKPFLTIATIEGTPLPRRAPIDPQQYADDMKRLEENGLKPPKPFKNQRNANPENN